VRFPLFILFSTTALFAIPAQAQSTSDHHDDANAEIVVTALYARNQADLLAGTSIVTGDELARDLRPTIGESLSRQAGVSSTSFGPNASRPVLRGFQGERVRVLADGIGSFDVSNTSVDHAVAINPLTADRIEVLRGPSALLFGSSAIGGVVNVIDSRIPRRVSDEPIHVDFIGTYGTAANERSLGSRVDLRLSDQFVAHFDGTYTKSANLRVGGFVLTPALRQQAATSGDADIASLSTLKGDLPNSAGRTWEVAGGLAWIGSNANLGVSVSHYDSLYGIPIRYATVAPAPGDPGPEEVRLDVKQTRFDIRGEINPTEGFLDAVKFRAGYADYKHNEIDDVGAIGTTFLNKGGEGRLEFIQRERSGWRGAFGVQYFQRNLRIIGDEKFLPPSRTRQSGLFTVQSLDKGPFRAEVGGRIEFTTARAQADTTLGNPDIKRNFTAVSGSLGGNYELVKGWRVGINASYSQRAPAAEELFANGPHAGTQAFEIGNPAFKLEKSKGLELTLRGNSGPFKITGSVYKSWFNGFIYEQPTGVVTDGLPVFQFLQNKARYYGAEVEVSTEVAKINGVTITLDGVGDFTRARIILPGPDQNAPRIPALRLLGGLEAQSDHLGLRGEVEWVDGQNRVASFETQTRGYTMVNASATIRPWGEDGKASLLLSLNNIFDVDARRSASFLKDYAPLPGRDFRATVRVKF
jgi:iron complex outermembrane recepter protein